MAKGKFSELNETNVRKVIKNLERVGRKIHPFAWNVGTQMVNSGDKYESSTIACSAFTCRIWNGGMVE